MSGVGLSGASECWGSGIWWGGGVHDAGGEAQEDGGLGAGYCVWGELSGYVGSRYRGDSRYGCVGGEA